MLLLISSLHDSLAQNFSYWYILQILVQNGDEIHTCICPFLLFCYLCENTTTLLLLIMYMHAKFNLISQFVTSQQLYLLTNIQTEYIVVLTCTILWCSQTLENGGGGAQWWKGARTKCAEKVCLAIPLF